MSKSVFTTAYGTFLRLLVQARHDAGLTQRDVAARLERPPSFVAKIELGERRCDLIEFREICNVLDIDAADFVRRLDRELLGTE